MTEIDPIEIELYRGLRCFKCPECGELLPVSPKTECSECGAHLQIGVEVVAPAIPDDNV